MTAVSIQAMLVCRALPIAEVKALSIRLFALGHGLGTRQKLEEAQRLGII